MACNVTFIHQILHQFADLGTAFARMLKPSGAVLIWKRMFGARIKILGLKFRAVQLDSSIFRPFDYGMRNVQ